MNYPLGPLIITCVILVCTQIKSTDAILNGRDPKLGEVKYEVLINSSGVICSGGTIGDKHVITAAHCIKANKNNNRLKPLKVVAATNSSSNYDPKVSIVKYVKRAFALTAFAKKRSPHDIAVLELSGSIEIEKNSDKLQKLKLPTFINNNPLIYPNHVNKKFKAAGFGRSKVKFVTDKDGKVKPKTSAGGSLHVADAIVLNDANCKRAYGGTLDNRMCYAVIQDPTKKTFQGFCAGDSGTPIVVDNVVIGVHTHGGTYNNNVHPSVAVKTTAFIPFIENAMNGIVTPDMTVDNAW